MEALGYVPREEMEDDWVVLVLPAEGAGVHLAPGLSETPVQGHPRIHLDLYAGDAADQAAEVERLMSLGAERVDWDLRWMGDLAGCSLLCRSWSPTASGLVGSHVDVSCIHWDVTASVTMSSWSGWFSAGQVGTMRGWRVI